jgi:hypothetical protein
MAASSFDLTRTNEFGAPQRSRFSLARLRAGGYGGGLGLLVIALGLLAIGIGWNGMAGGGGEVNGVPNLNAQLPWLVSGGLLGLALVVFGASMIIVHNARSDRARLEAKLDELVAAVSRGAAVATPYPTAPQATGSPAAASGVYLAGGSAYHRPDCRLVQGRDDVTFITAGDASVRDLKPCRVCKPADTISR